MKWILRIWYRLLKKNPATMPMVKYFKSKESVEAKITKAKDGSTIMIMDGEDYPIYGYPRGHILFGTISKLKHEIKQVFNKSWQKLEEGISKEQIIKDIKKSLFGEIAKIAEKEKYEMVPPEKMCKPVREIYRAWTKVSPETAKLRDYLCYILQEDDGYRMRVQWLVNWFSWLKSPVKNFEYALSMLEHGEVIGDMKERQRLLKRILMLCLKDESIRTKFIKLFKEINWKKVKLTKADKYHLRAKYFKCDLDILTY